MMTKIEEIKTYNEFSSLGDIWNKTLGKSANKTIFSTFEWLYTWWENFGEGKELMILLVKDGPEVIGIAPFLLDTENRFCIFHRKILRFIGEGISDYAMVITVGGSEEIVFRAVIEWLRHNEQKWDVIKLRELGEKDNLLKCLSSDATPHNWEKGVQVCSRLPYLKINGHWETYFETISKKLKKEIKWIENKLNRKNEWEYSLDKERASPGILEELFNINRERMREKDKKGWYEKDGYYNFIKGIINNSGDDVKPSISLMKIDGRIAAYIIGFVYAGKLNYWNVAIRNEYKDYSPGKMLLYYLIREMHTTRRVEEIDLLRGDEDYKYKWASSERKNTSVSISKL